MCCFMTITHTLLHRALTLRDSQSTAPIVITDCTILYTLLDTITTQCHDVFLTSPHTSSCFPPNFPPHNNMNNIIPQSLPGTLTTISPHLLITRTILSSTSPPNNQHYHSTPHHPTLIYFFQHLYYFTPHKRTNSSAWSNLIL